MSGIEVVATAATIGSFVSNITGHGQSRDGSSDKIRQSLCNAKTILSDIWAVLSDFEEDLTLEERKLYRDEWEWLNSETSEGLAQSIKEVNSIKRWVKRRRMIREARRIENKTLTLKSRVQISSMNAKLQVAQDRAYMDRKAKKMEVEDMELEIRYKTAKHKLEELN